MQFTKKTVVTVISVSVDRSYAFSSLADYFMGYLVFFITVVQWIADELLHCYLLSPIAFLFQCG